MRFTRRILGYIYDGCGGRCYYCSVEISPFGDWEVDHMTPREQGGVDALYNLVAACRACNRRKGNRTVEQYRIYIQARILNNITQTMEDLSLISGGLGTPLWDAYMMLDEAGNKIATADILFYGERADIPRKTDYLFSLESDEAVNDPSLDESGEGEGQTPIN